MADTYSQLYVHVVFAVKRRKSQIDQSWEDELFKYITGIVTNHKQKLMIINGMPDHIHILIVFRPTCSISDLVRIIKSNSSKWINEKGLVQDFAWQNGFGAFTVGHKQVTDVANYIAIQKEHHRKISFKEEYVKQLQTHKIGYADEYLFEELQ